MNWKLKNWDWMMYIYKNLMLKIRWQNFSYGNIAPVYKGGGYCCRHLSTYIWWSHLDHVILPFLIAKLTDRTGTDFLVKKAENIKVKRIHSRKTPPLKSQWYHERNSSGPNLTLILGWSLWVGPLWTTRK